MYEDKMDGASGKGETRHFLLLPGLTRDTAWRSECFGRYNTSLVLQIAGSSMLVLLTAPARSIQANHVHTCICISLPPSGSIDCRYLSSTIFRTLRQYSYGSVCLSSSLFTHLKSV